HGIQCALDLFPKRTAEEVDGDDVLETLPETCNPRRLASGRRISKLLKQLAIVSATGIGKPLFHLLEGAIVDGLHLKNRSLATLGADRRCQPFESFPVLHSVWKKVAGIPERQCSIPLQLPPNRHPEAGSLSWQTEHQQ